MSYALSHRLYFYNRFSQLVDIQILREGFSGTPATLIGYGDNPISISLESEGDELYSNIKGLVASLRILATSLTEHDEFLTYNNRMFKMNVYLATVLQFSGWIDPEICSKYVQSKYPVTLRASSGIGYLKYIEFKNNGLFYTGYKSMYSCIYDCLRRIDDSVKIYDATDIFLTTETSYSPLVKEYLDTRIFREDYQTAWDCYKVISEILKVKAVKMFRYKDGWYIVPWDYAGETINFRVLEGASGTQTATLSNVQLTVDVTNASAATLNVPVERSAKIDISRQYKEITVREDPKYMNNLFIPYLKSDFTIHRRRTVPSFSWDLTYYPDTEKLKLRHLSSPTTPDTDYCQFNCGYLTKGLGYTLKIKVKIDSANIRLRVRVILYASGTLKRYLKVSQEDDIEKIEWSTAGEAIFDSANEEIPTVDYDPIYWWNYPKWDKSIDITAPPIPISGYLLLEFGIAEDDPSVSDSQTMPAYCMIDVKQSSIALVRYNEDDLPKTFDHTEPGDSSAMYIPSIYNLIFSPLTSNLASDYNFHLIYHGGIYKYEAGEYRIVNTTNISTIAQRIIERYSKPRYRFSGKLFAHFNPLTILNYLDRYFAMLTFTWDMRNCIWEIESHEVINNAEDQLLLESGDDILLETGDQILLES